MPPITAAVGKRIQDLRVQRGMKQKHLAAALGVEPLMVSRYETGTTRISLDRLFEIADILKVSPEELLDGIEGELPKAVEA